MSRETTELEFPDQGAAGTALSPLLLIAWQHKSLLVLGAIVGLVLGSLYYAQLPESYRTTAQVLVIKNQPESLQSTGIDRFSLYEDYLATHLPLIKSELIVQRALQKPELKTLRSAAGGQRTDPRDGIIRSLTVKRDSKDATGAYNNILNLSYQSGDEHDGSLILQAILDAYREFLDETYRKSNDDTLELVTRARDQLEKDLVHKEQAYREFRQKSPLLLRRGKEGTTLNQDRLLNIEMRRAALMLRSVEIEAHLSNLEAGIKKEVGPSTLIAMISDWSGKAGNQSFANAQANSAEFQMLPLLQQEEVLLQKYGPNHPEVLGMRRKLDVMRDSMAGGQVSWGKLLEQAGKQDDGQLLKFVLSYVKSMRLTLENIQAEEKSLAELFDKNYEEARKLADYEVQDQAIADDITRTKEYHKTLVKRMNEVSFVKEFRGYDTQVLSPPRTLPVRPNLMLIVMASMFLGSLGGFGLAYLAHATDKSFRSPEEIRRRLGVPVAGHVPYIDPEEAAKAAAGSTLDPILCCHFQSKSPEAEMIRKIRTSLYFSTHSKGHTVVQITSPHMGDGKSTLAANLGISIAQSGKKVVIVDADFRRPQQHKLFGLDSTIGFASVIADAVEIQDALRPIEVQGLSILPCGPLPPNPAELLNSPRFKEAIDWLREHFDYVLVDTPPLLVVSDPSIVTPFVDGVLLNIRAGKNDRPNAERAKEILDAQSAIVLGVVVSGKDGEQGYGRYGSYGSYGRYSYGEYGYGYYSDHEKPGNEEPAGAPPPAKPKRRQKGKTTVFQRWFGQG